MARETLPSPAVTDAGNPGLRLRYAVRRGRSTPLLARTLRELAPAYELPAGSPADWRAVFGRSAPLAVEIGSGFGEHIVAHAKSCPEMDHVAIEFYPPGVAHLMRMLREGEVGNVRVIRSGAQQALAGAFGDGRIDLAYALFPDPWPKRRHRKRRLVGPEFAELLGRKMRRGGRFGFASDCADYACCAERALQESRLFGPAEVWDRRMAQSRYERRAANRGAAVSAFMCDRLRAGAL